MKLSPLYLAALSMVTIFSCAKNNDDQPSSGERIKKVISKSGLDSTWYVTFNYDANGRLFMIQDSNSQTHVHQTFVYFNSQNRLQKVSRFSYYGSPGNLLNQVSDSFAYDNANLISKKFSASTQNPSYRLYHTYSYDGQKRLVADSVYSTLTNTAESLDKFTYDVNDNVVQFEQFQNSAQGFKSTYIEKASFSAKINPLQALSQEMYFAFYYEPIELLSKNTLSQLTYRDGSKKTYSYEYNSNGLPKKLIELYQSTSWSPVNTTEFFYE
jgi:hypothetical protein